MSNYYMIHLQILHILLICIFLTFLTSFVNYKLSLLVLLSILFLSYLFFNNKLSFDTSIFTKENNTQSIYNLNDKLIFLIDDLNIKYNLSAINIETKKNVDKYVKLFIENCLTIYNNNINSSVPSCNYFIDIIHDQRTTILNDISSYMISIPNYQNYIPINDSLNNIKNTMDVIFNLILDKCNNISNINDKYIPINNNNSSSFSNSNSYQQF